MLLANYPTLLFRMARCLAQLGNNCCSPNQYQAQRGSLASLPMALPPMAMLTLITGEWARLNFSMIVCDKFDELIEIIPSMDYVAYCE